MSAPIPSNAEPPAYSPPPGPPPSHANNPFSDTYAPPNYPPPSHTASPPHPTATDPFPPSTSNAPPELPPAYAVVDEKATTYTIYGTFIHTPSGPAYQLSSLLDSRMNKLALRRLRAEEVSRLQAGAHSVPFKVEGIIYEAIDPPYMMNEYYIRGQGRDTLPGMLQLRMGLRKWHVMHMPAEGVRAVELMTCGKRGGFSKVIRERRNEMEPSDWKDMEGHVVATEVLKMEGGGKMPTIEFTKGGLDQGGRELVLSLWAARLWATFGAAG